MADNTTLPGTGDVIADEDISGIKYQLIKLVNPTATSVARWVAQQTKANSLPVVPASDYQMPILPTNATPTLTNVAANNTDMLAALDVSNYRTLTIQLTTAASGTISVQFSNDSGTTWITGIGWRASDGLATNALTTTGMYVFPIPAGSQMRIRTTSYASGTFAGNAALSSLVNPPFVVGLPLSTGVDGSLGHNFGDTSGNYRPTGAAAHHFNGSTWDRWRGNNPGTFLASAARTATANADITNYNGKRLACILNITAAPNTASTITLNIRVKDSISSNYITILSSVAIVGTASQTPPYTNRYVVGPGIAVVANVSANDMLARTLNAQVVHSNADSWTYSVSFDLGV